MCLGASFVELFVMVVRFSKQKKDFLVGMKTYGFHIVTFLNLKMFCLPFAHDHSVVHPRGFLTKK